MNQNKLRITRNNNFLKAFLDVGIQDLNYSMTYEPSYDMKWSSDSTVDQNLYSKTFYKRQIQYTLPKLLTFCSIKPIDFSTDIQVFHRFLSHLISL